MVGAQPINRRVAVTLLARIVVNEIVRALIEHGGGASGVVRDPNRGPQSTEQARLSHVFFYKANQCRHL
jgi:hypothetical protein